MQPGSSCSTHTVIAIQLVFCYCLGHDGLPHHREFKGYCRPCVIEMHSLMEWWVCV